MKGKLSLLSAAVIMALAGTSADATPGKATPTTSSPVKNHARGHFKAPLGSTVLYDQTLSGSAVGFVDQTFSVSNSGFDAQAADDFVVTDASGWTVNQVNIEAQYFNGSGPADSFDVNIFPDAGGVPGPTATCTYSALPYGGGAPVGAAEFTIPLSSPCALAQGTYWVSAVANLNFSAGGEFGWDAYAPASQPGAAGKWQNPGDGFGTGCTTWADIGTCLGFAGQNSMSFQVVGHVGAGGGGGISLAVTLAEANGDPAECTSQTTLSATVGDQVNFCYIVTNTSAITLNYQTLADDVVGPIFTNQNIVIAPGASYQYNRIVTASASESPTSTWTAQDQLPGYASSVGSATFVDITGSGTALGLGDDTSAVVTMPFSFNFYGGTSNQLCVNNNGFMLFATSSTCSGNFTNQSLPTTAFTFPSIMPFWDDLYTAGNVYTATLGTTPNRQFIVEWFNKDTFDAQGLNPGYTFEAILNEADNTLDFAYSAVTGLNAVHDGGLSATVGLQQDSTLANQYSFNTATLSNGQDILWTATTPTVFTASAQVTLDVGAPILALSPTSLSGTAAVGGTTTATLNIGNTGNRDLDWTLTEAGPTAHFPVVPAFTVPFHSPEQTSRLRAPKSKLQGGTKHAQAPLGGTVPSFGETFTASGFNYVSFDAAAPGTLNTITAMSQYFFAGTFANNDFTVEYGVTYPAGELMAISTADGSLQDIGSTGLGGNVTGIRWDSTSGTSYAMAFNSGSTTSCLNTLDLATGATTQLGCASGTLIIDIAIDPSGAMYGVDIIADTLVAIDKTTGAAQSIGSIGFNANFAQGMDFDAATGVLYLAGYNADIGSGGTYTVDLGSGLATLIGPIGPGDETDAFAIAVAGGPCATPTDVPWLSESPISGTTAPGGSDPVTVTFDATTLAAGVYDANVCVNTNDSTNRQVAVPVEFTVTVGNDEIFKDGFDGP